ncbi:hypothetical protein N7532_008403 [Penicillium argentinense]|uniref:DNA mismatch repair protein PMS1 n=1 Tax=Penicillium argentinense TaxID=1131581 RepID=A0A9W9EXC8_9EURO|nr:uncharacterized protein N7532_008403 [Penicillium argentinense]KAJ5089719.1 hypothetical protein N7532_008403 [Penicillium argentinense]
MATIQAIEARSVHQIQSGQVIVDLCSVAKELVENSLDAGATTIEIRFKNNGLDLIEVQDNGSGISPENYENIALKHYTSKLSSYDDLSRLHTFGFRGEALSSLCALSDFHIVTAQANQSPRANRLDFEPSGKLSKTQIVAGQKGTTASVEGIFKRLPVRRRELEKNIKREYGKVLNLLHAYACISSGVRFNVRNTVGKTKNVVVFSTNGNPTTRENIANVYGAKTLSALIPLDLELEFEPSASMRRTDGDRKSNQMLVRGHISRPVFGEGRQTPDRQMFFVNSRPCGLPQIAKAFNEAYKSFNVSQSPFIFADFQMDTDAYDVNVSPDKRQILIHDAGALIESLKTSLIQLFESADQTVPQSQVLGSKLSTPKQQALGALPGFASARNLSQRTSESPATPIQEQAQTDTPEEDVETEQPSVQKSLGRFSSCKNPEKTDTTPSNRPTRTPRQGSVPPLIATSPAQVPDSTPVKPREIDVEESQERDTDKTNPDGSQNLSSQFSAEKSPDMNRPDEQEDTPNVVQNAFDRMRPRRFPAEMATITIGGHTVKSVVGSGPLRKRTADRGTSNKEPPRRKRRIHTPSRPDIFGEHMKEFAAPGTQPEQDEDEDEEEEEVEESASEASKASEASEEEYIDKEVEEVEKEAYERHDEEDASALPRNMEYIPKKGKGMSRQPEASDSEEAHGETKAGAEENDVDEAGKRAEEEARVQHLIHQAEETAVLSSENNINRANKMNKGAIHRDATVHLVGKIDTSVSQLRSQIISLRESLRKQIVSSEKENLDTNDGKTAEDRLSLTVSKPDFAQMRIIGQFNLGFIIAVRPGKERDELFIIDQHASDEKFNFERLQAETIVQYQRLVRPQRLDLTAVEEEIVLENRVALEKNGFVVTVDESGDEPIGRRCQLVSLPLSKEVVFGTRDLEELIVLLSESPVFNAVSVPRPSKVRKMFAMRACRSSIMIGKTLTERQMQRVVRNMGTIDKPWNCPHGRPTMRHLMSLGQWDAWDEYGDDEGNSLDIYRRFVEENIEEEEEEEEEEAEG